MRSGRKMRVVGRICAVLGVLALGAAAAGGVTMVTLRPAVSVQDAGPVTLAEVATLAGDDAETLGGLTVIENPGKGDAVEVSIDQIRTAMTAAKVNAGRVTLRGATCRVTLPGAAPAAPVAEKPVKASSQGVLPQLVDLTPGPDGPTVRALVATRLAELFGVGASDIRLAFDPADAGVLDKGASAPGPGGAPTRTDVQPAATGPSSRVPVYVYVYEGERLVVSKLITAQAQVRRTVVVAKAPIPRGDLVSPDLVASDEQWLVPSAKRSPPLDQVVGRVAQVKINAGSIVGTADVALPLACKRNDVVIVHTLSGPFNVQVKARAMGPARTGELVELRVEGSKQTFRARMDGPGRAVKVIDGDATVPARRPSAAPQPAEQPADRPSTAMAGTPAN